MRILITGTDSSVGAALAKGLRAAGHEIHGTTFQRPPEEGEVRADLTTDAGAQAALACDPEAVVHVAGIVDHNVPAKLMFEINAGGTRRMARACAARAGNTGNTGTGGGRPPIAHFVQISSVGVYGIRTMGVDRRESATLRDLHLGNTYQRSKAAAEVAVETSGVPFSMLRLPAVLGLGDTVLTPTLVDAIRAQAFIRCGSDNPAFSVICLESLAPIVDALLGRGPTSRAFNCADHHPRWLDLAALYAAALELPLVERRRPLISAARHMHEPGYLLMATTSRFGSHFPTDDLAAYTGFEPAIALDDAVRAAVAHYLTT